ncbi:hypothetical protein QYF36_018626 [Acer negundo]|nr:hypothetical protein QYF36_018626 [Acer negundo]
MDFPMINANYIGIINKYGYTQVADSTASSASGMLKFKGLAKLYLEEPTYMEESIKVSLKRMFSTQVLPLSLKEDISKKTMVELSNSFTMKIQTHLKRVKFFSNGKSC